MKKIIFFAGVAIVLVLINACKKDNKDDNDSTSGNSVKTTAVFNSAVTYGTLTDQEGNVYKTVTIGSQTWMAENLRTTKYNDGTAIPNVTDDAKWPTLTSGAYCTNNNTIDATSIATYGGLYNWHAVNTGKLAPKGWHVPTDAEWQTLVDYLGGEFIAADKLKETGITHWGNNPDATNETGFTALPGGNRYMDGVFNGLGGYGNWWSATESDTNSASYRSMFDGSSVYNGNPFKYFGLSVRCLRD